MEPIPPEPPVTIAIFSFSVAGVFFLSLTVLVLFGDAGYRSSRILHLLYVNG
jgi:hypothetical protein